MMTTPQCSFPVPGTPRERPLVLKIQKPTPIFAPIETTVDPMNECQHETLNVDGSCAICGMVCRRLFSGDPSVANTHTYTTTHALLKSTERTLLKDMEQLQIPDDVRQRADQIYQRLPINTRRGNKRKQLIYWCVFNAFLELGYKKNPQDVARIVGIRSGEITKANSAYSEIQTGYRSACRVVEFSPTHFIPQYCQELKLDENYTEQIVSFAGQLLKQTPSLMEGTPQAIAAGLTMYYLTLHGVTIDNKQFATIVKLSEVTINKAYRLVAAADNARS